MNNSRRTFLLAALALLALVALVGFLVGSKVDDTDEWVRPVVGEEPVVPTVAPPEPQDALRTTTTTIPPRVRQKAFQAAYATEVAQLIREGFARFGPAVVEEALSVSWCESRHVATARNGVHVGPFQLSGTYHRERAARLGFTWEQVATEARANIAVAADLYSEQGWRPWQCQP